MFSNQLLTKIYYAFFLTFAITYFSYGQQWSSSGTNIVNTNPGNVAIGSLPPTQKLSVEGQGCFYQSYAAPDPGDGSAPAIRIGLIVGAYGYINANHTGIWPRNLIIQQNGGNVGIGTTNPGSYRLAVEGKISARQEVKVFDFGIPFPDYVFHNTYKLQSLPEVESYIKANNRLPEIPSAEEVECNGMNLAEMNILVLKKIEELTLHLIEQNKQLEMLKAENETLKTRMNGLEVK